MTTTKTISELAGRDDLTAEQTLALASARRQEQDAISRTETVDGDGCWIDYTHLTGYSSDSDRCGQARDEWTVTIRTPGYGVAYYQHFATRQDAEAGVAEFLRPKDMGTVDRSHAVHVPAGLAVTVSLPPSGKYPQGRTLTGSTGEIGAQLRQAGYQVA